MNDITSELSFLVSTIKFIDVDIKFIDTLSSHVLAEILPDQENLKKKHYNIITCKNFFLGNILVIFINTGHTFANVVKP